MFQLLNKPYKAERWKSERAKLPCFGRAIGVFQNGFGYSKNDHENSKGKKRRESNGAAHLVTTISTCHIVCLSDHKNMVNVFIHIDPALDVVTALYRVVSYLINQHVIPAPKFDDVLILRSPLSFSIRKTYLTLRLLGFKPRVLCGVPLLEWIGYQQDGKLVHFDKDSIKMRSATFAQLQRNRAIKNEALARRALHCANDGRFHDNVSSFEIFPGVPAFTMRSSDNQTSGHYSFNIPETFDFFPFRLPVPPSVHFSTQECPSGNYIHLYGEETEGPLSAVTIHRVQTALFAIAEQICESLK